MFNGNTLRDAVISAANNLSNNRIKVDELNVFPVPDGDTGTNMSLTLENGVRELERIDNETAGKVASVTASALLRGARGNSGVITSLLFRGFSKGIGNDETVTAENLANALTLGVQGAYKAVMKPTEGTILTVSRVASEYANTALSEGKDALGVLESAIEGANIALEQTPELLPALKKAGVVDAGGKGFVLILEGMLSVFKDGVIINSNDNSSVESQDTEAVSNAEKVYNYSVKFTLNLSDGKSAEDAQNELKSFGELSKLSEADGKCEIAVNTDNLGETFASACNFGQLAGISVQNLLEDTDGEDKLKKASKSSSKKIKSVPITKENGFVSVCAGDGIADLFREIGVDTIVSGGQTMNPSTDDILNAIESTPASTVYVLPNNKNIIMAAEQAINLSSRKVVVLHTRTVPQGVTAMINFDESATPEKNAIEMQKAAEKITTGQITFAARNSDYDGKKINKGDLMGICNGKIEFTDTDIERIVQKLTKFMIKKDSEFLTVMYGEDVDEITAQEIERMLNEKFGQKVEITFINGGQPVYYFIISVE